jgi:predicted TIM-barrel fold metal-dependent hydrolase
MARSTKTDPEPALESPIPFHCGSNGEYVPREKDARAARAEVMFRELVDDRSRRLGMSRRAFVESAMGTATALFVIQQVGCGGGDGGFPVDARTTIDSSQACEQLAGDQFVFDVQTHHVNPTGAWRQNNPGWEFFLSSLPQGSCGEPDAIDCFDTSHYLREMFINSDTHVAVLSAVPADPGENPLEIAESKVTMDLVNQLADSQRLVIHGLVLPDQGAAQIAGMQMLKETHGISAWKVYTPFGGWRLDDTAGMTFLDEARRLAVPIVCAHKGLPLPGFDPAFASPADIGVVAPQYTDLRFVVYHSGYDPAVTEGPYDPDGLGIDRLIRACLDGGIGPTDNVYAELGSTWRNVMTSPLEAQHVIGKLLLHLGPDRILWGTDSIWYGTPQDQITAFRALTISQQLQDQHGYPALTDEIKAKILGLNAAALYGIDPGATRCAIEEDDLAGLRRQALAEGTAGRSFRGYGPRTRREFFDFLRVRGGRPG